MLKLLLHVKHKTVPCWHFQAVLEDICIFDRSCKECSLEWLINDPPITQHSSNRRGKIFHALKLKLSDYSEMISQMQARNHAYLHKNGVDGWYLSAVLSSCLNMAVTSWMPFQLQTLMTNNNINTDYLFPDFPFFFIIVSKLWVLYRVISALWQ